MFVGHKSDNEQYVKCIGCGFVIEDKKLALHLNNKNIKMQCKKSYSKSKYKEVIECWLLSQLSDQRKKDFNSTSEIMLECRKCKVSVESHKLTLHLKNTISGCKNSYTNIEQIILYESWALNTEGKKNIEVEDVLDKTQPNTLVCKGCSTQFLAKEVRILDEHLKKFSSCAKQYTDDELEYVVRECGSYVNWIAYHGFTPETFKLETTELNDQDLERILKLEYVPNFSSCMVDKLSKPIYVPPTVFNEFSMHANARIMQDYTDTCALILGYENEFGYHSTELIYPMDTISKSMIYDSGISKYMYSLFMII